MSSSPTRGKNTQGHVGYLKTLNQWPDTSESPQPPQSIPPFEQAILDLIRIVDDFVVENRGINAHSNQRIVTVEDNLNNKLDGLKNDFEHKWDNLQDSTEDLIDQQ